MNPRSPRLPYYVDDLPDTPQPVPDALAKLREAITRGRSDNLSALVTPILPARRLPRSGGAN